MDAPSGWPPKSGWRALGHKWDNVPAKVPFMPHSGSLRARTGGHRHVAALYHHHAVAAHTGFLAQSHHGVGEARHGGAQHHHQHQWRSYNIGDGGYGSLRELRGSMREGAAHLRIMRFSLTASSSLRNTDTSSASDSPQLPSASAAAMRAASEPLTPGVAN
jgi:hypothetical protein